MKKGNAKIFFIFYFFLWTSSKSSAEEENKCDDLKSFESAIVWPEDKISYWVDGFRFEDGIDHRASLAILIKHQQSKTSYIDKIVFTDSEKNTVSARYFSADDKIASDYLPYLIFSKLSLRSDRFHLYLQIREDGFAKKYRYTFSQSTLKKSKLSNMDLPADVRFDLQKSHTGIVSNSYFFRSSLLPDKGLEKHRVDISLLELSSDNQFKIKINFTHADVSPTHFMRYFLVTDPVGRILGLYKRPFGEGPGKSVLVSALTEKERESWGLTKNKIAKINDCPYVLIFTDDAQEALMKSTLWLR